MTLEQINSLQIEDVLQILRLRISPQPTLPDPEPEDYDLWYESSFTEVQLQDEFVVYKAELYAIENERLRKEDINIRFNSLHDMRKAFHETFNEANPDLWLKNLLLGDHDEAESKMVQLESSDSSNKSQSDSIAYIDKRKAEYPSIEELIVAMWENDQLKIQELEDARQLVKSKYPKG